MIDQLSIDVLGLSKLIKDLRKINHDLYAPNLQMYRAKKFKDYTTHLVKSNQAGLKPISSATVALSGEHDPMYLTGQLLAHMEVRRVRHKAGGYSPGTIQPNESAADVGYFPMTARGGNKIPGKKISWTKLAILHHTGYRIPLTGKKGQKVRAWLALNGINIFGGMGLPETNRSGRKVRGSRQWIIVEPRPFFLIAYERYKREGKDMEAVVEYFNRLGEQMPEKEIKDNAS